MWACIINVIGSRPHSLISVSSTLSSSIATSSSRGSRKDEVEYDVPRLPNSTLPPPPPPPPPPPLPPPRNPVFNAEDIISDILNVLEEEPQAPAPISLMATNASSYSSLTISSNSSADNLGVWDDINYEDEEEEEVGVINIENPVPTLTEEDSILNEDDEVLLDNWIKELESGVQRMSGLLSTSDCTFSPTKQAPPTDIPATPTEASAPPNEALAPPTEVPAPPPAPPITLPPVEVID